jgi:hypothetical protein
VTPQQARAIYSLTATPEWQKLNEYWQSEIDKLHESCETCRKEDLERMQGDISRLKDNLKLRYVAEAVLESEK